ncbi:MAG: CamS family sex pheromone protein, partial [Atopostipes suicloacalis]|nr:CamS family sex pheromone protein [Atopostipes suicloacalis]
MKIKKRFFAFALPFFLLASCQSDNKEDSTQEEERVEQEDESAAVSRNQLGKSYYRPALDEEGHYVTSQNRGETLSLNSGININLFEKDLIRLSQENYPTDQYFVQEGQYLSEELVSSWIGRESE